MSNIRLQCVDGNGNPVFLVNNSGTVTASTAQLTNANITTQTVATSIVTTSVIATGNSNTIGSLISTGGNMGVGITTPGTRLDVRSTSEINGALIAQFGGSSTPRIQLYDHPNAIYGAGLGAKIYMNSTNVSIIEPSGSLSLIPSGGFNAADVNVGISTTSPQYTLDVNGTISLRSGNGANGFGACQLIFGWNNSNNYAHSIRTRHQAGANDSNNAFDFYVWQTSDAASAVGTKHRMSITSQGVGIGTQYPSDTLHVKTTSGNTLIIVDSVSGRSGIEFYNSGTRRSTIYKPDGLDDLRVYMDGLATDVMTFTTNGNIGMRNNSPQAGLDIASQWYGNTFGNLYVGNAAQNRKIVLYSSTTNDHQYYGFGINGSVQRYQVDGTGAAHRFYAATSATSSNELMCIQGNGNVGIGTTNPAYKLHVNGDIAIPYGNAIRLNNVNNTKLMEVVYTGAYDQTRIYAPGSRPGSNNTIPRITIRNDGYIGINTTSPAKILDLQGSAVFGYATGGSLATSLILTNYAVTSGSAAGINMGQGSQYTRMYTTNVGTNTNRFDIDMTGNSATYSNLITAFNSSGNIYVGILTTSPQYTLDVAGHINVNGFASRTIGSYGFLNSSGSISTSSSSPNNYSVYASHRFAALQFDAYSDERIKKDIQDVNDISALETIRAIQPKRYKYVDKVSRGNTPVWGFIAQQVGSVLEYSTKQIEQYIPNVYKRVTVTDGNILSSESFDTSVLDSTKSNDNKIHLRIVMAVGDNTEKMLEVTVKQIKSATEIEIEEQLDVSEAFIYGQRVNDFHTLNKDAIFTVSVAALQEVDRNLQTAKERLANKDPVLDTMEQQVQDILTRLQNANL